MSTRSLEIDLPDEAWRHIDRLVKAWGDLGGYQTDEKEPLEVFLTVLLDHVQQGVYRSGAWERSWLEQCVGSDAIEDAYSVDDDPAYKGGHIDRDGNRAH